MFTYMIDDEIQLKLLDPSDASAIFALTDQARPYLRQWLPWVDGTKTIHDTEQYIESTMKGFANRQSLTTAIFYQGKLVGVAGFNVLDWTNNIAYIGYWLGESYQGKGIMTRVVRALTTYAINDLEINRVEVRAATQNHKSRAIPEKLGFHHEGNIRQAEKLYDHYVDHAVYSVLAEEWPLT
ncbi:putative ribosomal N-acetyltransferase YdaF [Paraliobacillus ryukyuensis]|uniref:Ribosomal-protein-serine acetyltransferase n=1 Tax=Paraliobacillus ryukyuensis TaxID=200904 RepID=A0A366EBM6_9BACI|nr:GNAT family protein [Paraliobacillus ryukyuensis]RBO99771.1 ribosomal-protein-serine acetyltransferase [Paraliobacillus ryukyuensis]